MNVTPTTNYAPRYSSTTRKAKARPGGYEDFWIKPSELPNDVFIRLTPTPPPATPPREGEPWSKEYELEKREKDIEAVYGIPAWHTTLRSAVDDIYAFARMERLDNGSRTPPPRTAIPDDAKMRARRVKWRRMLRQGHEYGAMKRGKIGMKNDIFVTDCCNKIVKRQNEKNQQWLKGAVIVNEAGEEAKIPALNKKAKFADAYARLKGMEKLAKAMGLIPVFCTATLPANFHSNPTIGKNSWSGESPIEGHAELTRRWRALGRMTSKRDATPLAFVRCTEPHKDGTVHWHWLAYVFPGKTEEYIELCKKHFGQTTPAFDCKIIDNTTGGAAPSSYVTKYILKALSVDFKDTDTPGDAAQAWRSTWNVRGYQIGGKLVNGSATMWRQCRKIELDNPRNSSAEGEAAEISPEFLELLRLAQGNKKEGKKHDFADFLTALRGRWNNLIKTEKDHDDRIIGLAVKEKEENKDYSLWRTKRHSWKIAKRRDEMTEAYEASRAMRWNDQRVQKEEDDERARLEQEVAAQKRAREGNLSTGEIMNADIKKTIGINDGAVGTSYPRNTTPHARAAKKEEKPNEKTPQATATTPLNMTMAQKLIEAGYGGPYPRRLAKKMYRPAQLAAGLHAGGKPNLDHLHNRGILEPPF